MDHSKTINLVKCPYCNTGWIDEEISLCCITCTPQVEADLLVVDLSRSIENIRECDKYALRKRIEVIRLAYNKLTTLLKEIDP